MVLVSVSIHEARVSSTFFGGLKASRRWKLKKIIILENIKSNELSLVFSKTVSKGLWCDKVWGISIFFILHTYPWYLQKVVLKFGSAFLSFSWESKIALLFTFPYPVPVPKNCMIFIGCNFKSRSSQVGLHKQEKDTASAKKGKVSFQRRGGQRLKAVL